MDNKPSPEGGEVLRPPYARSAEVALAVKRLKEIKLMQHIEHKELAQITGEPYGSGRYYSIVNSARDILAREDNIVFESVLRLGYQRCDEQTKIEVLKNGTRRISRKTKKLRIVSDGIDISVLVSEDKLRASAAAAVIGILEQATRPQFGRSVLDRARDASEGLSGMDLRQLLPQKKKREEKKAAEKDETRRETVG
jgi:hypothetical protein